MPQLKKNHRSQKTNHQEEELKELLGIQAREHADSIDYDKVLENRELADHLIKKIVGRGRVLSGVFAELIRSIGQKVLTSTTQPTAFQEEILKTAIQDPLLKKRILKKLVYETGTLESFQAVVRAARETPFEKIQSVLFNAKSVVIAFLLFGISLLLPTPEGLSVVGHRALSVFLLAMILWVTEAIPIPVTSLVICVMLSVLGVVDNKQVFSGFGHYVVFFLIGSLLLGVALVKVNLHKRIALTILSRLGSSTGSILAGILLIGFCLSMLMNEHGVAAMMCPIVLAMVHATGIKNLAHSSFTKATLLALTYGCSIGSTGSLLGGGRNPLAIAIYQQMVPGGSVSFLGWMAAAIPISLVMVFCAYLYLRWFLSVEKIDLVRTREYVKNELRKMGKIRSDEKKALAFFLCAFILWATLGTEIGLAVVGIGVAAALIMTKTLSWKDAERGIPWGIIFLYGGAICLGNAITQSGAAQYLGSAAFNAVGSNPYLIILALVVAGIFLTEVINNSACVSILLPVAITALASSSVSPIVAMYAIALPSGLAFMLPIGTPGNAIVYSTGLLQMREMAKVGFWMNIIGIIVFMTVGLAHWKLIGLF